MLSPRDLSAGTGIAERTLEQWRYRGIGPEYCKVGGRVRYRREAIEQWLAEHTVKPSTGRGAAAG